MDPNKDKLAQWRWVEQDHTGSNDPEDWEVDGRAEQAEWNESCERK